MITKHEFDAFIKSLNKKAGEYTLEELFDIGLMHKQLPTEDKSWKKLTARVGYPGQPGSYRNFVFRRQKSQEIVDIIAKEEIKNNQKENNQPTNNDQYEELYRKRVEISDIYNTYRAGLRNESRLNTFKELLVKNIQELKDLPVVKYDGKFSDDAEAILMLSDLHIGVDCANFYNTYNSEIAKKRLSKLAKDTISYCKKFNIKQLNVLGLGDFIHGIIHINARINAQMNVVKQIIIASEYIADLLNDLQEAAPIVTYRSCTDNHSRVSPNKEESVENENLNKLIDYYLGIRLSSSKVNFISDNLDDTLGSFRLKNGKHVVYAHGHLDNINRTFENFVGATRQFVDYMILGHYHCEKAKSFQGARVFVNGSICGTEEYALSKRLFSEPSQTLLIFNNDNLLNISINLNNV
ncbi:MAG: hypothetical protein M0Q88_00565 [Bacilli bacterium]|nr:hypothetical protein [Bacilli bacterium]